MCGVGHPTRVAGACVRPSSDVAGAHHQYHRCPSSPDTIRFLIVSAALNVCLRTLLLRTMRMPRRPALGRQPARQCTAAALREVCQRNTTHRKSRAACAFADAGAGARFTARARDARARAAVPATAAKAWWKASPEFWEEIKDEAHFDRVVNESGFELVLVGAAPRRLPGAATLRGVCAAPTSL